MIRTTFLRRISTMSVLALAAVAGAPAVSSAAVQDGTSNTVSFSEIVARAGGEPASSLSLDSTKIEYRTTPMGPSSS
jgi:hypothetical protein